MRLWQIDTWDNCVTLDMGPITIMKGSHKTWFKIAREINDFFTNRVSEVKIYEDGELINKKDWECLMIPFNESLQLDKVNTKSPLQIIHEKIVEFLAATPQYESILEEWEVLKEEEEIINRTILEKFDLQFRLKEFDESNLKDFFILSSYKGILTPIDSKLLTLKLLLEKEITKRLLIIIELPELYADEQEIEELLLILKQLMNRGCYAIIITTLDDVEGRRNFILKGQVINEARVEMLRSKVFNTIPIPIENEDFLKTKELLLSSVDKVGIKGEFLLDFNDIHRTHIVVLYVILKLLEIEWDIDFTKFPPNLKKFFAEY